MKLLAFGIRVLYRLFCLFPVQDKVAFLSRQSARPFDFELLEQALRARFGTLDVAWACGRETEGHPSVGLTLRQLWQAATSRVVVVDGYMPAVAIPANRRSKCLLIWHAMGAVKKFGYQSLGTSQGRTSAQAEAGRMHRGYDAVVVGLANQAGFFSQAFDVPEASVRALGVPRMDYLLDPTWASLRSADAQLVRDQVGLPDVASDSAAGAGGSRASQEQPRCRIALYAPTLRRGDEQGARAYERARALARALPHGWMLLACGHPLQPVSGAAEDGSGDAPLAWLRGVSAIRAMELVDAVVTDYSAVAFEAALARKPVFYYVPDIRDYRESPGLNIDPLLESPQVASEQAEDIARMVASLDLGQAPASFAHTCVEQAAPGSIERILDALEELLVQTRRR